jgi:hypothetical protein
VRFPTGKYANSSLVVNVMNLIFTKGAGKYDRLEVIRSDLPAEVIECPKQGIIPHDMVHYAVEHVLAARGFLHRVKAGEPASFHMQAEDHSDAVERLVEVFQGDQWSGGTATPLDMIDLYRVTCAARGCSMLPIDQESILCVRSLISDLSKAWLRLAVGKSMSLSF